MCFSNGLHFKLCQQKTPKKLKTATGKDFFLVKLSGVALLGGNCQNSWPTSCSTYSFDGSRIRKTALAPQVEERAMKINSANCSPGLHSVPLYYYKYGCHLAPKGIKIARIRH